MRMKLIGMGMDKVVIKIANTFVSKEEATAALFQIFNYHQEDVQCFPKLHQNCYFSKNFGTDFKVATN